MRSSDNNANVVLISDDAAFAERMRAAAPAHARFAVMSGEVATGSATVLCDAETATAEQLRIARVVFHGHKRPVGLSTRAILIHKSCSDSMLDVLWERILPCGAAHIGSALSEGGGLPAWIVELQQLDLQALTSRCVQRLPGAFGFESGALYVRDARSELFRLAADNTDGLRLPRIVPDQDLNISWPCDLETRALTCDDGSGRERVVGLLCLSGGGSRATLCPEQQAAVMAFAARALDIAQQFGQARVEARLDCKTGLFNDRWAFEALETEVQRAQRYGSGLAVIALDVDGLKQVNDRLGHHAGDLLLREVADRIRSVLRQADAAARVGGDEFLVILPEADLAGAEHAARRIEAALRLEPAEIAGRTLPLQASLGAAVWSAGMGSTQLLEAADAAMYRVKHGGRSSRVLG